MLPKVLTWAKCGPVTAVNNRRLLRRANVERGGPDAGSNEAGISLIEMVVAIGLAALLLVAGLAGLTNLMITTAVARQNQASVEVLEQTLETVRGASYAATAMVEADLAGDTAITRTGTSPDFLYWFDHDDDSGTPDERIVVAAGGTVNPHIVTMDRNNTDYTISTYVTDPPDTTGDYRRVTVRAEWGDPAHRRQATTFVTETRRGLPLPKFRFGDPITVTVTAGNTLVLPATLTNRGARDSFDLTSTTAPAVGWTFTWHPDTNGNGAVDAGENAFTATGPMETDQVMRLLLVAAVPSTEATATKVVTLKATSVAQSAVFETFNDTVNVLSTGCGAPCIRYFTNDTAPANSLQQTNMPMGQTAPTAVGPFNFDTNKDGSPGRLIAKGGTGSDESDPNKMANWHWQVPGPPDVTFNGTAKVTLYATMKNYGSGLSGKLNVYVRSCTSGAATTCSPVSSGTQTISPWPASSLWPGSFTAIEVSIPAVNFTLARNKYFEIKVEVDAASGDDMWIAYQDVSHPARVEMPVTSGVM